MGAVNKVTTSKGTELFCHDFIYSPFTQYRISIIYAAFTGPINSYFITNFSKCEKQFTVISPNFNLIII